MTRHVLIIGGGLAGPCLALSLARRNIRSTVFEIRAARNESGGSISLGPNALQVLDRYAGVYDRIQASGYSYRRFGAYADDGEKFGEISVGTEGEGGYPTVRVMRSTVNKVLVEAGEEMGLVEMKWAARLESIEENEQGVTAHFEDGSGDGCDILIGADGIHSKVRQHILGAQNPTPIFENICIVNGFLPTSSAITPNPEFTFPAFTFTPGGLFMTIPIDPKGETLAWGINMPDRERKRSEWSELEKSGEAARQAKATYDDVEFQPVRSLLDNADETKARVWAPYSIPDIPKWHTSRVCLIGDAAHALPPNGLGSALAFEDAAILTRLLTTTSTSTTADYDALFDRFEAIRRPRIAKLRKSAFGGTLKGKTGPWVWYIKKWAFRGFFWWKGGVLQHDDDKVDLDV